MRPGDWIVLVTAIFAVVGLSLLSAQGSGTPQVRIDGADQSWIYPLDAELELEVPGPLGKTVVHISGGKVWVSDSPCRQKLCISAGAIDSPGAFNACLPNRVLMRIESREEGEIDDLAF